MPDDASLEAIGPDLMDPSRRAKVAAAGTRRAAASPNRDLPGARCGRAHTVS